MAAVPKITSIEQLVDALDSSSREKGYLKIMRSIAIPANEFEKYYTWSDEHYTRNCLSRTDDYELLLICLEKGQRSPIHNFDSQDAWIHPISGKLKEERYLPSQFGPGLEKVSSVLLGENEFSYMSGAVGIHRYSNAYDARSVSLNLYSKPVDKWQVYDKKTGASTEQKVSYDWKMGG